MTLAERNKKLKCFITCLKCEVSGKCCDENCPTQYDAGNTGEVIENLEAISKALEQEPKEDTTFTFGQENKVALLINLDENIYKTIKRGFLDTFEIRDVREAIINGKKVIGEVTEEPKKDNEWIATIRKNGEHISRHMKEVEK